MRTTGPGAAAAALVLAAAAIGQAAEEAALQPIRVLFLEGRPRWEFRYATNILRRAADVDLRVCLTGESKPSEDASRVPLPTTRGEFDAYDVILVGDVALPGDSARQQDWMLELMGFLDRGRGVAFLRGDQMPSAYRGTILELVLPVGLLPQETGPRQALEARLQTTGGSKTHPVLRLEGNDGAEVFAKLPVLHYVPSVQSMKPGSQALLVDREHMVDGRDAVVVAAGRWVKGRTLYIGTDETWRWRDPSGEKWQAAFWCNVVRFLAGRLE